MNSVFVRCRKGMRPNTEIRRSIRYEHDSKVRHITLSLKLITFRQNNWLTSFQTFLLSTQMTYYSSSFLCLFTDKGTCTLTFCLVQLAEYSKLSSTGTFRNRNFGVKHSFLAIFNLFYKKLNFSVKRITLY